MADVESKFGNTLWDQWESVETYTKVGIQSLERFSEYIKQRVSIEAEYAQKLQKLARAHKDEVNKKGSDKTGGSFGMAIASGTVAQSWLQLLTMTEHTAAFHTTLADQLEGEIRKSIKAQVKENEKIFKQHFDEIRKATLEYRKVIDNLEKVRLRYDKATKDMDIARQAYESANQDMNKTAKDIEKLRLDAEKKAMTAQDAAAQYRQCVEQTNAAKEKHLTQTIPNILDQVQAKDEYNRIAFTKKAYLRYSDLLGAQAPSITTAVTAMVDIFGKINPGYDSATFIKMCRTNTPLPSDFTFEERPLTPSSTAAGRKTTSRGFTKTRDEIDDNKEDAIVTLPGKQGRKKAMERIKVLDKELADVEKKKQGVDTLMSVYSTKPEISQDPKVARDLDDQLKALEQRIALIKHKKYKLQVYIATIDGTPLPEGQDAANLSPITPLTPDTSSTGISISSPLAAVGNSFRASTETSLASPVEQPGHEEQPTGEYHEGHAGSLQDDVAVIAKARVLYDFAGSDASHELSVTADEMVDILEKQDDGWWKARVQRPDGSHVGFIPGNYTEEI